MLAVDPAHRYPGRTETSCLDLFGYTASLVILVSLMMRSIFGLRWINLAGRRVADGTFHIDIDDATPACRDVRIGRVRVDPAERQRLAIESGIEPLNRFARSLAEHLDAVLPMAAAG